MTQIPTGEQSTHSDCDETITKITKHINLFPLLKLLHIVSVTVLVMEVLILALII